MKCVRCLPKGTRCGWEGVAHYFSLILLSSEFKSIPFFDNAVSPIINVLETDQQGNLLVGTFDGIYKVSLTSGVFESFADGRQLLQGINVRSLLVDRSGLLWVGSREKGLFYGRHQPSAFSDLTQWGP